METTRHIWGTAWLLFATRGAGEDLPIRMAARVRWVLLSRLSFDRLGTAGTARSSHGLSGSRRPWAGAPARWAGAPARGEGRGTMARWGARFLVTMPGVRLMGGGQLCGLRRAGCGQGVCVCVGTRRLVDGSLTSCGGVLRRPNLRCKAAGGRSYSGDGVGQGLAASLRTAAPPGGSRGVRLLLNVPGWPAHR